MNFNKWLKKGKKKRKAEKKMVEKVYRTMKSVGAFNIVMGILIIISGITTGVIVITEGARLLRDKSDLTF